MPGPIYCCSHPIVHQCYKFCEQYTGTLFFPLLFFIFLPAFVASPRVLLSNPRWETQLLRFLELSGVGRVMENGVDVEEAQASRMDKWEAEEREAYN